MKFTNSRLLPALAILVVFGTALRAQTPQTPRMPQTATRISEVQLGDKTVLIPDPAGFEEAVSQFDVIKQRMMLTEAPVNDVLLAHLLVSDCELLRKGSAPTLDRYTKVSVLKAGRAMT